MPVPPPATSSTELLNRARAGDGQALNSLIELYLPRLRRWATGRLPAGARQTFDTDDVVQETVIAALRNIAGIEVRGEGALQAYLRRAVGNRLTDLYRNAERRGIATSLRSDFAAADPSPLEEAIGAEALARYEAALSRLQDTDREAIILRIELRCGYEEMALALGKSSAAHARTLVSRALARLAREMDRAGA